MTTRLTSSKLLLIADSRSAAPTGMTVPIRRYRIARLRVERASLAPGGGSAARKTD